MTKITLTEKELLSRYKFEYFLYINYKIEYNRGLSMGCILHIKSLLSKMNPKHYTDARFKQLEYSFEHP